MIKSASRSSITNDQKYRSMLAGTVPSSEYLISTTLLTQDEPSVTFDVSSFAGVYKHLQIVIATRSTRAAVDDQITLRLDGDTAGNYSWHRLLGNGSNVSSTGGTNTGTPQLGAIPGNNATANMFGGLVVDLVDAYSSTKNKTIRSLNGFAGSWIALHSIFRVSTNPINSIQITALNGNLMSGSRFSVYGVTA